MGLCPHGRMQFHFITAILKAMQLTVNGALHSFEQNPNLSQLLETLNLTGKRLAVERNGEIVPRSQFAETLLADGDKLEIVVAVGGG
jgi:sulfur carrier protein